MMRASGILSREMEPTVLLLDSDSLEDRAIVEDQLDIGGYLSGGSGGWPHRFIQAVPQTEGALFMDRTGLEMALGRRVLDEDWFEARFRPRAVFRRLVGGSDEEFECRAKAVIDALDERTLEQMARFPALKEIGDFVLVAEQELQESESAKLLWGW
jgi:hypothetical protein